MRMTAEEISLASIPDSSRAVRLGVNVDHVATLRQARHGHNPDPIEAALACERAGASSIVCHLREDRRHIQEADVRRLKRAVATRLNLEMSAAPSIVAIALNVRPAQATLVPERRRELTTEGGLDARRGLKKLKPILRSLEQSGIRTSLFIDPALAQVEAAKAAGASMIELHTGRFAGARTALARAKELRALERSGRWARELGLIVAAGHGLDYESVAPILEALPFLEEVNIGFSIIARALSVGLEAAVREMIDALQSAQKDALPTA